MGNAIFEKLYKGESLTQGESEATFDQIFSGSLDTIQLSSFLTALKMKGETASEVAGAATAMLKAATPFPKSSDYELGEIVGTGGDALFTINISTMSAVVAAEMGLHIGKHGNRSVSSKCGASDVLAALGYHLDISPEATRSIIDHEGFAFFFAPVYHSAMRFAAPVRKSLGTRTIFNILGPLTNPGHADYAVIGVYDKSLTRIVAETLRLTGMKRAIVACGNGMDEISIFGETHYTELFADGHTEDGIFTRETFGIEKEFCQDDLRGGTPEENRQITIDILSGRGKEAHRLVVAANTAALVHLARGTAMRDAFNEALRCIDSGRCLARLERVISLTNSAATAA
ncbi:MAG: anthranilate phosphoribosyltransferase [Succinivibrionaceae bacterium]|nr:anthranilate phosphoribosyltransferase [Succinivibrionaceae bacterium]